MRSSFSCANMFLLIIGAIGATESSPEILSTAVKACAVFVGNGIAEELYRMGRILKLLITLLESCKGIIMLFFQNMFLSRCVLIYILY